MLKFIRGKGHHPTAERIKLQQSLFSFKETVQHGFLHHPSAMAWDPELKLLAIGSKNGTIKVFGAPGVELYGYHDRRNEDDKVAVTQMLFLPNQGRVVTLLENNSLHLWEINAKDGYTILDEVKTYVMEGSLKKVSVLTAQTGTDNLYLGTEGGNIYIFDVKSFTLTENIIYQDVVIQNATDDFKVNPGAVEVIRENPKDPSKLLIGYTRGMIVLWDTSRTVAEQTYVGSQLESASWHRDGQRFMTAHADGSHMTWSSSDSGKPAEGVVNAPYGPFPCKPMQRLLWSSAKGGDYVIFTGGMPRSTFGDKLTLSIIQASKHTAFEMTSKIVDFIAIGGSDLDSDSEFDNPSALLVLAEEEIVAIDLQSADWQVFQPPYLNSLHSSSITCSEHFTNVADAIWEKLSTVGKMQHRAMFSSKAWPVTGGEPPETPPQTGTRDLLLTGHEDGTVKFWDASGVDLTIICSLSTSKIFTGEEMLSGGEANEEEWPPFRRIGCFDPFSDDPKLAVKKISFCCLTGALVVAGTAGQVVVYNLLDQEKEVEIKAQSVNIVSDRDGFVWKGHDQLTVMTEVLNYPAGLIPISVIQLYPPSNCTALALNSEWGLVAVGTTYGFALFDYIQQKSVMIKCTLNPNDLTGSGDTPISRRKSLKKSLRESFRRLRKGRSQRVRKTPPRSTEDKKEGAHGDAAGAGARDASAPTSPASSNETKPVERQVEARKPDDAQVSMVRCLYLTSSYIVSVASTTPTLWAGTNSGAIYVFTVSIPPKDKRKENVVACSLGKEIQLKHRAPVIAITIIDSANVPLPDPGEVEAGRAKAPETAGYHRVLICSEEQFKLFTLPSLKPYCKFKLTAHEGARVRRVGWANFKSNSNEKYSEWCIVSLTNLGDISIYSLPDLRRQTTNNCIRKEDPIGILSLNFTKTGEAFYLQSSSELQRLSLSTVNVVEVKGSIPLPEGARPAPPPPPSPSPPPPEEQQEAEEVKLTENIPNDKSATPVDATENDENAKTPPPQTNHEVSIVYTDEERKDESADITIDSVRDHITTTIDDHHNVVTLKKEERIEVERKEHVTTIIKTGTVTAASEAEAVAAILAQES